MGMTDDKVLFSVKQLETAFKAFRPGVSPKQYIEAEHTHDRVSHLLWMCETIPLFLAEDRREKAMRWLGFLQGSAWALRIRSIESMKQDNKPEDSDL